MFLFLCGLTHAHWGTAGPFIGRETGDQFAKVSFSLAMLERNLRSFGRQGPTRPQALGIMMTALGEGGPAGSGGGGDFCINVSDVIMILYCVINKNILV